jgi:AbrB family looped-hinge helix DNA binding protein
MTVQVTITPSGRMSLPADIRRKLGLIAGGSVFIEETEDGIVLRTAAQAVARAQAIARRHTADRPEASVDAFLAARRADSGE